MVIILEFKFNKIFKLDFMSSSVWRFSFIISVTIAFIISVTIAFRVIIRSTIIHLISSMTSWILVFDSRSWLRNFRKFKMKVNSESLSDYRDEQRHHYHVTLIRSSSSVLSSSLLLHKRANTRHMTFTNTSYWTLILLLSATISCCNCFINEFTFGYVNGFGHTIDDPLNGKPIDFLFINFNWVISKLYNLQYALS